MIQNGKIHYSTKIIQHTCAFYDIDNNLVAYIEVLFVFPLKQREVEEVVYAIAIDQSLQDSNIGKERKSE